MHVCTVGGWRKCPVSGLTLNSYHIVRRGFQWCRVECCHAIVVFLVPRVCVFLHHCGSNGRAMRRVFWNSTALLVVGATNGRPTKQLGQASDGPSNQMSHLVVWLQGMWWGNTWVTCEGKASPPPCLVICYSFFVRKILINCVCNSFALILVVKIWGGGGTSSRLWQTFVLETTAAPTRKDKLTHSVTPPNDVPTVSCLAPLFLMTTHLPQGSKSIFWCITRKSN